MYTSPTDPNAGVLDVILCWCFYIIGTVFNEIKIHPEVTFVLQNTSFLIGSLVGIVTLMRYFGVNTNIRERIKSKKKK